MTDRLRIRRSGFGGRFLHGLHRLADSIALALCILNRIEFESPWNPRRHRC